MKSKLVLFISMIFVFTGCSHINSGINSENTNEKKVASFYNKMIEGKSPNIAQLNLFFSKMPKGGDLHHHYSGSIYVESYLDWAKKNNQLIDKKTLRVSNDKNTSITVDELRKDTELYRKLLTLWSDLDYGNHFHLQISPDLNFFNTFGYFGPVDGDFKSGFEILKNRAIEENVSYIETMLKSVGYSYLDTLFDKNIKNTKDKEFTLSLDRLVLKIDADASFENTVNSFISGLAKAHKDAKVDDDQFMMRYQTYASRNSSPSEIFSALYAAFTAAQKSELLVGVNFVGPENGVVAIEDYSLHMQFFAYFKKRFPKVNIALHAGELTLGMVRPKNLKFHISQALDIGGAQRIGHGVDLPYEENPIKLLQKIKEKAVIEINLTSNEFILGVKGQEHPYLIYSAYDVPLIISTDDSGVSRNNLSAEYVLLATRYKPNYYIIKKYVYNSIKYSFLLEADKKALKKSLDKRFEEFESQMLNYSAQILK